MSDRRLWAVCLLVATVVTWMTIGLVLLVQGRPS